MYLAHFGLSCPPFRITPDTRLFYAGGQRGAVLRALGYAIENGEGVVKVVGEVGSGKTMLCRMLERQLPEQITSIYLGNPSLSPDSILPALLAELELQPSAGEDKLAAMKLLERWLLEQHRGGRRVVVFVEEAQAMPAATLEEIRLLSNLETEREKLLQIVLFGQPELDQLLSRPQLRQLRERITHHFELVPLGLAEVREYLALRLRLAGFAGTGPFSSAASRIIARHSQGLIRRINILADKALLASYAAGLQRVGAGQARLAAADSGLGRRGRRAWAAAWAAALMLVVAAVWWPYDVVEPDVLPGPHGEVAAHSPTGVAPALPPRTAVPESHGEEARVAAPVAPPFEDLAGRLEHSRRWIQGAPAEHFSIQLALVEPRHLGRLVRELQRHDGVLDLDRIYLHRTAVNSHARLAVLYNEYADRDSARQALLGLPPALRNNRPYLRSLGRVRAQSSG